MNLSITNNSGVTKTYLGTVVVTNGATVSVTNLTQQLALSFDGALRSDVQGGTVTVGDGTNTFGSISGITYLSLVIQVLGPTSGQDPSGSVFYTPLTGVSTGNSTAALLGISATFTGSWIDVSLFSNATVVVIADQVSATNGLVCEYSSDGTNVDDNDSYTIVASNGQQFSIPLPMKYFRIRYINGGVAQGVFRLQTKIHTAQPKPSSHRLGDTLTTENDSLIVKAGLMAQKADTTFGNIRSSTSNDLGTSDVINVSGQNRAQSVTTSAAEALGGAVRLVNRKFISIQPSNGNIYFGFTSGVTTSTGTLIYRGQLFSIAATDNVPIYVIAAQTTDVRIVEGA